MEMTDTWTEQDWTEWEKWVQSGFGSCDPCCSPDIYYLGSESLHYSIFDYGGIFV